MDRKHNSGAKAIEFSTEGGRTVGAQGLTNANYVFTEFIKYERRNLTFRGEGAPNAWGPVSLADTVVVTLLGEIEYTPRRGKYPGKGPISDMQYHGVGRHHDQWPHAPKHVVAKNGTMTGQRYIDEVLLPHVRLFQLRCSR
ncbi:hypothetical protein TNCV_1194611 [Trichonephila clavipes]|nr:hypothetical protein TNCV_1194611 [Trichonephila clavipes]